MWECLVNGWYVKVNDTAGGVAGPFRSHSEAYVARDEVICDRECQQANLSELPTNGDTAIGTYLGDMTVEIPLPCYLLAGQKWPASELIPA
jgi:hypothetical protein